MSTGKCPNCQNVVLNVTIQDMPIHESPQPRIKGVSYVCPNCQTILGVGFDPMFLADVMKDDMLKILGR